MEATVWKEDLSGAIHVCVAVKTLTRKDACCGNIESSVGRISLVQAGDLS